MSATTQQHPDDTDAGVVVRFYMYMASRMVHALPPKLHQVPAPYRKVLAYLQGLPDLVHTQEMKWEDWTCHCDAAKGLPKPDETELASLRQMVQRRPSLANRPVHGMSTVLTMDAALRYVDELEQLFVTWAHMQREGNHGGSVDFNARHPAGSIVSRAVSLLIQRQDIHARLTPSEYKALQKVLGKGHVGDQLLAGATARVAHTMDRVHDTAATVETILNVQYAILLIIGLYFLLRVVRVV